MTEAKRLYEELLLALHRLIPHTLYQDRRHLKTLAWAVTGLCLTQTVHLSAWAEVVESQAILAASRIRRFSRWLHQDRIVPLEWYRPVIEDALSDWPPAQPLSVALDTTALTPFVLIRASLIYRGRAIPLAWRVKEHQSTTVAFSDDHPVLLQLQAMLPARSPITLLADRGFVHEALLHFLRRLTWHFRLRLMSKTLIHQVDRPPVAARELAPPAGEHRFFQQVALFASAFGPVHLAVACVPERPDTPWFIASDEPASVLTLAEYALRFDIEGSFFAEKSGGFQLQKSELTTADVLERLLLIIALSTLYLTSIGASVIRAGQHRLVDHHWDRGLSSLQLGARFRRQQEQRGWPSFLPFRLDPAPDPLPAVASRRTALAARKVADLPMAA